MGDLNALKKVDLDEAATVLESGMITDKMPGSDRIQQLPLESSVWSTFSISRKQSSVDGFALGKGKTIKDNIKKIQG